MIGSLSRVFGLDVGQGSEIAKSCTIFRRLVRSSPGIEITGSEIVVSLGRSAKSALLLADGFAGLRQPRPWLDRQSRPQTALLLTSDLPRDSRALGIEAWNRNRPRTPWLSTEYPVSTNFASQLPLGLSEHPHESALRAVALVRIDRQVRNPVLANDG